VCAKSGLLSIASIQLGPRKLSVIRSSWVSAIQGLVKYRSEWEDSRDFQNCPLYCGCPLIRGSTVYYWEHIGFCGPINQHVINKCKLMADSLLFI